MDVVILAGGLGTRLRSVVSEVPKCMAPVCGKPFLFYILKYLSKYPVENVILSVGYLKEYIQDWIQKESHQFPFSFDFAIEENPLGTGGGIKLGLSKCTSSDVLILNGDTFFQVNLLSFQKFHQEMHVPTSLALKPMTDFERYGSVNVNSKNIIETFNEKAFCKDGLINGGVYFINQDLSGIANYSEKFSFEKDFLEIEVGKNRLAGFKQDGYFIDIGIPEDYAKANLEFQHLF